ncbi:MAG: Crp/Fnr family transcriptional regulator [Pseudomonadales bacterium]|nr:Crp/Fnr family transcriptional regulator [Pseudomonadales bacterium]MCP5182335.1 Crp/Fnr family transcriptional regulator [Pseudomonadales bacterium]
MQHREEKISVQTLSRVPSFRELPEQVLETLAREMESGRFEPRQAVFRHLEASRDVFVVLSGSVRVALVNSTGRALTFQILTAGSLFGEIAAIDGRPRSATIVAETEAVVGRIRWSTFLALTQRSPEFCWLLMRRLTELNRHLTQRLFEYHAYDVRGRICCELLRLSSAAQGQPFELTDRDMATRVGTTRENVTRIHGELRRDGLLHRQQGLVHVPDPGGLEALLQRCEFG